jgi:hypothetical protein
MAGRVHIEWTDKLLMTDACIMVFLRASATRFLSYGMLIFGVQTLRLISSTGLKYASKRVR